MRASFLANPTVEHPLSQALSSPSSRLSQVQVHCTSKKQNCAAAWFEMRLMRERRPTPADSQGHCRLTVALVGVGSPHASLAAPHSVLSTVHPPPRWVPWPSSRRPSSTKCSGWWPISPVKRRIRLKGVKSALFWSHQPFFSNVWPWIKSLRLGREGVYFNYAHHYKKTCLLALITSNFNFITPA